MLETEPLKIGLSSLMLLRKLVILEVYDFSFLEAGCWLLGIESIDGLFWLEFG